MTPEKQRIAIAETCGWTNTKTVNNPDPTPYGRLPKGEHPTMHGKEVAWDLPLPSYLSDLNAMHEAENRIHNSKDAPAFARNLMKVVCGYTTDEDVISINGWMLYRIAHATAAQRAEAFLRTLNLWQNS